MNSPKTGAFVFFGDSGCWARRYSSCEDAADFEASATPQAAEVHPELSFAVMADQPDISEKHDLDSGLTLSSRNAVAAQG